MEKLLGFDGNCNGRGDYRYASAIVRPAVTGGVERQFLAPFTFLSLREIEVKTSRRELHDCKTFNLIFIVPAELSGVRSMWALADCDLVSAISVADNEDLLVFWVKSYTSLDDSYGEFIPLG